MSKISPLAFIDPSAKVGENCEIGPFCFIDKNVVIGDNNVPGVMGVKAVHLQSPDERKNVIKICFI